MALSNASKKVLVVALADKRAADAFEAAVNARSALSAANKKVLAIALTSRAGIARSAVDEVAAAVVSGAALSLTAKRRILVMMASARAGNELINFIQTTPTASIKL